MSASTTPTCPIGLTSDDLSAWRDHALAPDDERRIADHIGSCPACPRTVTAHEALVTALRTEQSPAPDPRNWPQLQARITSANGQRRATRRSATRHTQRHALWGSLGAVAAVLLISALFFRLFEQRAALRGVTSAAATVIATPSPLSTVAPTKPIAGPALAWQTRMAPESVIPPPGNRTDNSNIAVSPSDAQTAYICFTTYASQPSPIAVWATHDGARTWTHVSDLPAISASPDCIINIDAHDPLRLNIVDFGPNNSPGETILSSVSDDGGTTWRTLSDNVSLEQLATRGNTSVAVANPLAYLYNSNPNNASLAKSLRPHLIISRDGFRTWSLIDSQLTAPDTFVTGVWQRPGDGALLALVATQHPISQPTSGSTPMPMPSHYYTWDLWSSSDEGANWTRFPTPPNFTGFPGYLVAQPVGSSPWTVCGSSTPDGGASPAPSAHELIGCTYDGGKTWVSIPLPDLQSSCGPNCLRPQTINPSGSWLLSDGSLVAMFYTGPTTPNTTQTPDMYNILRLRPGANQWQNLGPEPGNALIATSAAPHGALVSYEGGTTVSVNGPTSGVLVGHLGWDVPNRGALAIATLP